MRPLPRPQTSATNNETRQTKAGEVLVFGLGLVLGFNRSESRQDFRHRSLAETLGEFRYKKRVIKIRVIKI